MPVATPAQIRKALAELPEWTQRGRSIRRTFVFGDFEKAIDFVNRVAARARRRDHHPDIAVRWNRVSLVLTTHAAGGLTGRDFSLASECDRLATRRR